MRTSIVVPFTTFEFRASTLLDTERSPLHTTPSSHYAQLPAKACEIIRSNLEPTAQIDLLGAGSWCLVAYAPDILTFELSAEPERHRQSQVSVT